MTMVSVVVHVFHIYLSPFTKDLRYGLNVAPKFHQISVHFGLTNCDLYRVCTGVQCRDQTFKI